jgi:hypothetical protein
MRSASDRGGRLRDAPAGMPWVQRLARHRHRPMVPPGAGKCRRVEEIAPGRGEEAMINLEIRIKVEEDNITVTMPGTKFSVTYQKQADTPNLVMTRSWLPSTVTT